MDQPFVPASVRSLAEIDLANASYSAEVVIIKGVVAPGYSGGRSGKSHDHRLHIVSLAAWGFAGEAVRQRELVLIRAAPPNIDYYSDFSEYTALHIRALISSDETRAIFHSMLDTDGDRDLVAIAEELRKPVVVSTTLFGDLTLDRRINWFAGVGNWNNQHVEVCLYPSENGSIEAALATAEALWSDQANWKRRIETYAVTALLVLKNGTWLDGDEMELSAEAFLERMTLNSITISPGGRFEFWHDDGDLFWGHAIQVCGNLTEGCTDVDIPG